MCGAQHADPGDEPEAATEGATDEAAAVATVAVAAIEALVAPTEEMVLAGWDQLSREPSPHAAEACWQAMIAVALQQKQEG